MTDPSMTDTTPETDATYGGRIDLDGLKEALNALRAELRGSGGEEDLAHLLKIERWGHLCSAAGYATAWIAPNPISALLISQGKVTRWAIMSHHVLHKGYDKVPGMPERYTSRGYARGWRRWLDWPDWIKPEAWEQEHNIEHHYKLNEQERDPDLVEVNLHDLRESDLPMPLRYAVAAFFACTWKWTYYAPNTLIALRRAEARRAGEDPGEAPPLVDVIKPWSGLPETKQLWLECWLPYAAKNFVLSPLAYLPLGPLASLNAGINLALAELATNLHTFLIIVPNHAGEDVWRFEEPAGGGRGEFYLRQIVGSVNYATGDDLTDFLHGWLNYQIEHHVFPDLTLLQYQRLQPRMQALCERFGIPYVQESVWTRARKMLDVMVGKTSMLRWGVDPLPEQALTEAAAAE